MKTREIFCPKRSVRNWTKNKSCTKNFFFVITYYFYTACVIYYQGFKATAFLRVERFQISSFFLPKQKNNDQLNET